MKEAQSRIWGLKLVLANKTSVRSPEWTSHYPSLIFFSIFKSTGSAMGLGEYVLL